MKVYAHYVDFARGGFFIKKAYNWGMNKNLNINIGKDEYGKEIIINIPDVKHLLSGCFACKPYEAIVAGKAEYLGVGGYGQDMYSL